VKRSIKRETQAIRFKKKLQAKKRQPKEEKLVAEPQLARPRKSAKTNGDMAETANGNGVAAKSGAKSNGNGRAKSVIPVTVHSFPARVPIAEPHVVRSSDSSCIAPMTLEEAVKKPSSVIAKYSSFATMQETCASCIASATAKMELIEA